MYKFCHNNIIHNGAWVAEWLYKVDDI